jgi:anti-anti-sigma factor
MVSQAGSVQWTGRQAVMMLPEQIDVSNAGQIREALLSAINRGATSLIADMSATISCDYAGADAVVRANQRAVLSGTELRLVVTAQIVRRVLSTSGLDRLVAIYPSLESATAARAPAVIPAGPGEPPADRQAPPDRGRDRLDTIITSLFHVGLSLQAAGDLPPEATRQRVTEALGHLDEVIGQIRDTAFADANHYDA